MIYSKLLAVALILKASASNAFLVRDIDGSWKSLKRSMPGDVLRLPLTSNDDQSYSVRLLDIRTFYHECTSD